MVPFFSRIRPVQLCVLAGSLLAGCVFSGSPATRFYILSPMAFDTSLSRDEDRTEPLSLEVASIRLPQYLERPQIVTRISGSRLRLAENHQWGGNLRKNMMRVLAKNLSDLLDTPNIAISPYRPRRPPDYLVDLEVMRFERDPDGHVRFSVQWRLSRGKDREPLSANMIELESPKVRTGSGMEPTVAAMSRLLGELSRIIGKEIVAHAENGTQEMRN